LCEIVPLVENRDVLKSAVKPEIRWPTRKEIDLYYKTHRSQFLAPERVRILHIIKNVDELTGKEEARRVMELAEQDIAQGADFSAAADRYSDCPGNGGELGWFSRGVMVEEFEDLVFALETDETSPIFETRFGLHLVRLLEKRPAGIRPFREVYDQIADQLYNDRLGALSK
jgi:peptidyl-prolyl cis-trans isomerase C